MATEMVENKVQNLFDKLEAQRTILSTCTDLYKTLTSHFTSLEQSIASKSQTLESKIESLDSDYDKFLQDLQNREDSIPDRLSSLSSLVESQKQAALSEFEKPSPGEDAPLVDALKSMCRKMDHKGLLKLAVARKKEAVEMRLEIGSALTECVDPPRLVLDTVKEFLELKASSKGGLTDKRRACATLVVGMFPPEELKEKKWGTGPGFSRSTVERAETLVSEWKEKADKLAAGGGGGGGGGEGVNGIGMGSAEAAMFLQIVLGFGLKEKFEEEFYRKLAMEFAARRDMPKLAIPLFGDKIGDIIDELVKNGKQVEAVYFATESGLTERFQPSSLLKSFLQYSKNNATDMLKKGNHTHAATEEATSYEMNSIRSIIKCVEDHKMETEFPIESLKKRLAALEKARADKKKGGSTAGPKPPSNKRGYSSSFSRSSGPPPPRPAKMTKFSSPYPPYGQRNPVSPAQAQAQQSPGSRYPAPYNYPSYGTGLTSSAYAPSYGGSHIPPAQVTPQHYGIPSDGVGGAGGLLGGSYGGQTGYGSYDYSAVPPPAYKPSSFTQ